MIDATETTLQAKFFGTHHLATIIAVTAIVVPAALLFFTWEAPAQKEPDAEPTSVEWRLPIYIRKADGDAIEKIALRLTKGLKLPPSAIGRSDNNPVCCLYLDVGQWTPTGSSGFVAIIQPVGGLIIATDADQLEKAVDSLLAAASSDGDLVRLPIGVLTNYPSIAAGPAQRQGER